MKRICLKGNKTPRCLCRLLFWKLACNFLVFSYRLVWLGSRNLGVLVEAEWGAKEKCQTYRIWNLEGFSVKTFFCVSVMESSSSLSGSSKRAKAPGSVGQVAHCLVDGCNADLSRCREYHRRHKVCELHSKTPKVTIGGREQRFCQQCSRWWYDAFFF